MQTSSDGKWLARFVGQAEGLADLVIVDVPSGKEIHKLRLSADEHLQILCFSHDGKYFAASSGSQISLWDLANGKRIRRYEMSETYYRPEPSLPWPAARLASASSQSPFVSGTDQASVEEIAKFPLGEIPSSASSRFRPMEHAPGDHPARTTP